MIELNTIQTELNAPKNLFNRFGGYSYRNAEGIFEALKPLLIKTKCSIIITDDVVVVGGRIYIKATATLTNAQGESVSATGWAQEPDERKGMDAAQVTGSSSSYARKYALNGLFAIDDCKDPDALHDGVSVEDEAPKPARNTASKKAAPAQAPVAVNVWTVEDCKDEARMQKVCRMAFAEYSAIAADKREMYDPLPLVAKYYTIADENAAAAIRSAFSVYKKLNKIIEK